MDRFRKKTDHAHTVAAFRLKRGDWMVQYEPCGMFHGVNDWYFTTTYEPLTPNRTSIPERNGE